MRSIYGVLALVQGGFQKLKINASVSICFKKFILNHKSMLARKLLTKLKPYVLSSHKAWQIDESLSVLKLDWNEATIGPSPLVLERLKSAINSDRLNWYPDINNKRLIEKIANYSSVKSEEVQYFASSDAIHEHIIRAFVDPLDLVLIISPTYDNFRAVADLGGARIEHFYLDDKFLLNYDNLQELISRSSPKMVYLVNPNNPTGTFEPIEEIEKLALKNSNVLFVIDEAYYEFVGKSIAVFSTSVTNIVVTRTFSKAFALASFRIGYVISNELNILTLNKIRNPKNISLMAQVAATAALDSLDYTKDYISEIEKSRLFFTKELERFDFLSYYSSFANFVFVRVHTMELKEQLMFSLESNLIFIRDYGHVDLVNNYVRFTLGTVDQMKRVVEQLKIFQKQLPKT
jgi:histidinol-phosphate aminotransferase